jgi:hypothetical protein
LQFSLAATLDAGGFRSSLVLPFNLQTNFYVRDLSGRLLALTNLSGEPIVSSTIYAGSDVVRSRVLGNSRVQLDIAYDGNQRVTARRYKRTSDGQLLADMRYAYDRNAVIVARQDCSPRRALRLFCFRSRLPTAASGLRRPSFPWSGPESQDVAWILRAYPIGRGNGAPGSYARMMAYNEVDLVTGDFGCQPRLAGTSRCCQLVQRR